MAGRMRAPLGQETLFEFPPAASAATAPAPDFSEPPLPETEDARHERLSARHERLSARADSLELTGLSRPQAEVCAGLVALETLVADHGTFRRRPRPRSAARRTIRRAGPAPEYHLPPEQWNLQ